MPTGDSRAVCVVGMGPRGLCVLERLVTNAADTGHRLHIDVVDPYPELLTVLTARAARQTGRPLHELVATDERIAAVLTRSEVVAALDPARYVGAANLLVDRILQRHHTLGYPLISRTP